MSNSMNNNKKIEGAGLGARFGAYLIDSLVVGAIYLAVAIVISLVTGIDTMLSAIENIDYAIYFPMRLIMISYPVIWFIYSMFMELGQEAATIGKRKMNLKVVYKDGTRAKGLDVLVRNLIKNLMFIFPILLYCPPHRFGYTWINVRILIGVLLGFLCFALCAFMAAGGNHRGLHDILAGTLVVNRLRLYAVQMEESTSETVVPSVGVNVTTPKQSVNISVQSQHSPVNTVTSSQNINIQTPQRPVNVSVPGQMVNIQTPQRPVGVSTHGQGVNINIPQKPVSPQTAGPAINIQTPQKPLSVSASGQTVNIQTPQRPVSVSAPGQTVNIQTPQRPVSVSAPGQTVNIQTPQRPVGVSTPGQSVNINIPQKPVSPQAAGPAINIQTPQKPLSVSVPGQTVNIQTPQRPVSVPGQTVNIQTNSQSPNSQPTVSQPVAAQPVVKTMTIRESSGRIVNIPIPTKTEEKTVGTPAEKPIEKPVEESVTEPSKLVCQGGMYSGAQFALDKPIIMGLDGNICTIIFRNDSEDVGKVHCRVELLGGKAYLEDLGSLCATYANTKKLAPYEKVELSLGDCVKLGAKEIFILK